MSRLRRDGSRQRWRARRLGSWSELPRTGAPGGACRAGRSPVHFRAQLLLAGGLACGRLRVAQFTKRRCMVAQLLIRSKGTSLCIGEAGGALRACPEVFSLPSLGLTRVCLTRERCLHSFGVQEVEQHMLQQCCSNRGVRDIQQNLKEQRMTGLVCKNANPGGQYLLAMLLRHDHFNAAFPAFPNTDPFSCKSPS